VQLLISAGSTVNIVSERLERMQVASDSVSCLYAESKIMREMFGMAIELASYHNNLTLGLTVFGIMGCIDEESQ